MLSEEKIKTGACAGVILVFAEAFIDLALPSALGVLALYGNVDAAS